MSQITATVVRTIDPAVLAARVKAERDAKALAKYNGMHGDGFSSSFAALLSPESREALKPVARHCQRMAALAKANAARKAKKG